MTDKEKIEKLIGFIEFITNEYGIDYLCHSHLADEKWCEANCNAVCPTKECYRHFLLGE